MAYGWLILVGVLAGFLSKLLGIGGGVLFVPLVVLFCGFEMKVAIGTSLAYIVPIALLGALLETHRGHVEWKVLALVVPCGVVGVCIGAWACDMLTGEQLKRIFGVLMVVVGLRLLVFSGSKLPGVPQAGSTVEAVAAEIEGNAPASPQNEQP